jgi:hypothetical protein
VLGDDEPPLAVRVARRRRGVDPGLLIRDIRHELHVVQPQVVDEAHEDDGADGDQQPGALREPGVRRWPADVGPYGPQDVGLYSENETGAIGTGIAIGDYDGDGRPDIFVVSKTRSCRLFRNLGDWKFEDVTEKAGVGDKGDAAGSGSRARPSST